MRAESQSKRYGAKSVLVAALAIMQMLAGVHTQIAKAIEPAGQKSGKIFYLDGAGGGGPITDWGRGVLEGIRMAGNGAEFENVRWQTGLGVLTDQLASVEYKRGEARKLAEKIRQVRREQPTRPVHLIGLSAGTAIVIFALEALPEDCQVDSVTLLASSMSADYDLTQALRRVRGRMNVFMSSKDALLSAVVPGTGSADRKYCGSRLAGLIGFQMLPTADAESPRQYRKLATIAWRPEFTRDGNAGGHTDFVAPRFVCNVVTPLLVAPSELVATGRSASVSPQAPANKG